MITIDLSWLIRTIELLSVGISWYCLYRLVRLQVEGVRKGIDGWPTWLELSIIISLFSLLIFATFFVVFDIILIKIKI